MPKSFFLKNNKVSKERVQLVGVTSMQIASKYEEIYSPEVEDFVYITDKAYCRNSKILQRKTIIIDYWLLINNQEIVQLWKNSVKIL